MGGAARRAVRAEPVEHEMTGYCGATSDRVGGRLSGATRTSRRSWAPAGASTWIWNAGWTEGDARRQLQRPARAVLREGQLFAPLTCSTVGAEMRAAGVWWHSPPFLGASDRRPRPLPRPSHSPGRPTRPAPPAHAPSVEKAEAGGPRRHFSRLAQKTLSRSARACWGRGRAVGPAPPPCLRAAWISADLNTTQRVNHVQLGGAGRGPTRNAQVHSPSPWAGRSRRTGARRATD